MIKKALAFRYLHLIGLGLTVALALTGAVASASFGGKVASVAATLTALLTTLSKVLPTVEQAVTALPDDETAKPKDGGAINLGLFGVLLVLAFGIGVMALVLFHSAKAHAQDNPIPIPQIGFCTMGNRLCFQPAVAVSAFQLRLSDMSYSRVMMAAGYGGVYKTDKVNLGAAIYFGQGFAKDSPNAPQVDILFSVADVVTFGPGIETYKDPSGDRVYKWLLTAALNMNVFGTPTYAAKEFKATMARAKGAKLYTTEDGQ